MGAGSDRNRSVLADAKRAARDKDKDSWANISISSKVGRYFERLARVLLLAQGSESKMLFSMPPEMLAKNKDAIGTVKIEWSGAKNAQQKITTLAERMSSSAVSEPVLYHAMHRGCEMISTTLRMANMTCFYHWTPSSIMIRQP